MEVVPPIRVVVADDDLSFRGALVDVLEDDPRFVVVGIAGTGDELMQLVDRQDPDVVLLDIRMPGGGPEAARRLTRTVDPATGGSTGPVVVAVSAQVGANGILAMLRAGATGYLGKGRLGAQLPDLVARTLEGEVVLAVPGAVDALRQLLADAPAPTTSDVP
ncbi:DNA-binding NarL/FixJ family response regulator [Nocardioides ginsengisegetis]|uniref:DNA-binding NarL/FixJ family response regulator n=1 Tax=Nocardioides ginsengisegetis TaxID=661491 RepID=A0A7W3J333_9ACTN|nr:response regulator transcription factor [Nocardioides ginsengisegetis]MBA8805413.1 DNA-binding NarL/FixJ family response regulator [Nocardioides ginsengisegetis]